MAARILVVDDTESLALTLRRLLEATGYSVETASTGEQGLQAAQANEFDLVLCDLHLPGIGGLEVIKTLRGWNNMLPIIMMTGFGESAALIEATRLGAYDYVIKPFVAPELLGLIEKALENYQQSRKPAKMAEPSGEAPSMTGTSRPMQALYKEIGRAAATPMTVLIRGETGTGKELVARAIYQHSDRSGKIFLPVNCTAIPETLLESELFGHEKGAFTGAAGRRTGRFEEAEGGTLFLDEIGDMTLETQAKLLRVLQERKIQRLGGNGDIDVDVRVIAATHRDLEEAIAAKQFREDLYFRLSAIVIKVPSLRERRDDVPVLAQNLLGRFTRQLSLPPQELSAEVLRILSEADWRGNVRQMENVLREALLLARGYRVTPEVIRQALAKTAQAAPKSAGGGIEDEVVEMVRLASEGKATDLSMKIGDKVEKLLYAEAFRVAGGNQLRAAQWLGVSRPTMRQKLVKYGLLEKEA